ncbi:MAG TPA: DUF423 domain-containing protein [Chitinophagaceae bacterium]|nr:DUF423 domain-containing protein [Chitinophagaceae bacterium]
MLRNFISGGAFLGGLAVAIGAFGAHGLQRLTDDTEIIHSFQTGAQYQMYHSLALLAVGILYEKFPNRWLKSAGYCFLTGIALFSGSLYLLTLLNIQGSEAVKFVGPITPIGGLFFIAGWLCLLAGIRSKQ